MQMMPNYRFDSNPSGQAFPTFTYTADPNTASEMDLDFNMLSEYLFNEEDLKVPQWNIGAEDLASFNNPGTQSSPNDLSDQEDESSVDETETGSKRKKGDKNKSQDQIDRRRERNRVLARKTRLRKKFFFESLQKQVSQLASENEMLKNVIRQRMTGEIRNKILSECKPIDLPPIVANNTQVATSMLERADFSLIQAIQAAQRSFVITDPSLPDNPIIFASKGFLELCGYQLEEVLGRNCRFLQGPNTDAKQVETLRKGILEGTDTSVCLLNYRADGSEFYNQIFVAALKDSNNKIINYVGVQVEIKQGKIVSGNVDSDLSTNETSSSSLMNLSVDNTPGSASNLQKRKRSIPVTKPSSLPQLPPPPHIAPTSLNNVGTK
mmetsp:Transcript_5155/g.5647  ORF Transcript_5155/g.5647 Transcript_5155/m.5647 type:complete len:380 (-) Transcript_5155:1041-2180(-)|eukprot:gene2366-2513_t